MTCKQSCANQNIPGNLRVGGNTVIAANTLVGGNTTINGTTQCKGQLQLFNTVNASDGQVLINPRDLTCAFTTVQTQTQSGGPGTIGISEVSIEADEIDITYTANNQYNFTLDTSGFYSTINVTDTTNWNDIYIVGTSEYKLTEVSILDSSSNPIDVLLYQKQ